MEVGPLVSDVDQVQNAKDGLVGLSNIWADLNESTSSRPNG